LGGNRGPRDPDPRLPGVPREKEIILHRYDGGWLGKARDVVAGESPLVLLLNDRVLVRLRCLPTEQEALALGFLLTEGLVDEPESVRSIRCDPQKLEVWVEADVPPDRLDEFERNLTLTTACGGGITSEIELRRNTQDASDRSLRLQPETILNVIKDLHQRSDHFKSTGAVHSACLAGPGGEILLFAEDVGRHNAVDKVVGLAARRGVGLRDKMVASSGRLTFEIVAKLARVGVPCVISRAAPSAQALEIAEEHDLTVIGFARGRRFNVYTAPWRMGAEDCLNPASDEDRPPALASGR